MLENIILKIAKDKEIKFLVTSETKKILDEGKYLGEIADSALKLLEEGEEKEIIISNEKGEDILRVQLQHDKNILTVETIK